MQSFQPGAVSRVAVAVTPPIQFKRRFSVALVLTIFDLVALMYYGPYLFLISVNSLALKAAYVMLFLGMITSLARTWFLTFTAHPARDFV